MLFKNGGKHVYINWVAEKILSGFIVVAACVMTFEARDSAAKSYLQRTHKPLTHMNTGGSSIHRHKVSPNRTDSSRRHTGQGNPSEFTFFYIFQIFYPLKVLKKKPSEMISKYNRNGLLTIGIPTEDILPLSSPWNDANNNEMFLWDWPKNGITCKPTVEPSCSRKKSRYCVHCPVSTR